MKFRNRFVVITILSVVIITAGLMVYMASLEQFDYNWYKVESMSSSSVISDESSFLNSASSEISANDEPIPPPPIELSTALMPKKFGYIPQGEDRVLAQQKLESYKSLPDTVTVDNAFIIYAGCTNFEIAETLRKTGDIHELVGSDSIIKDICFYYLYYDNDSKQYCAWFDSSSFGSYKRRAYDKDKELFYTQLFNPEAHERIKRKLGVNEITEILCFQNSRYDQFCYLNTDKGEYLYNSPVNDETFVTFDEFIDRYDELYPHDKR